jgi:hypothetical protein
MLAKHGFQNCQAPCVPSAVCKVPNGVIVWCQADTGREYMHAATRHCYYQRAELQLLLRQLRFCAAELNGAAFCHGLCSEPRPPL